MPYAQPLVLNESKTFSLLKEGTLKLIKMFLVCGLIVFVNPVPATALDLQKLYWHDEQKLTNAKEGRSKYQEGRDANKDLWNTLLRNQQKGYEANQKRLEASGRIRFEGILVAIDDLEWDKIWSCGEGTCEEVPNLEAYNVSQDDLDKLKKLYPSDTTDNRLKAILNEISTIGGNIEALSRKIKEDPNGEKELSKLPAGEASKPLSDLKKKIQDAVGEIDKKSVKVRKKVNEVIAEADSLIEKASSVVEKIFDGESSTNKSLNSVLEILRKKEFLNVLEDGPLKTTLLGVLEDGPLITALKGTRETKLPDDITKAFKAEVKDDKGNPVKISNVGELLDFLGNEQSEIEEIRLSLLQDMRENLVEIRASRLNELKAKLSLMKPKAQVLTVQRAYERGISTAKARITNYEVYKQLVIQVNQKKEECKQIDGEKKEEKEKCEEEKEECEEEARLLVVATLETLHKLYQNTTPGKSRQDVRDEFEDVLLYLAQYTERIGYLRDAEVMVDLEMKSLEHKLSIERSRIATLGREAMISRGLDGLVSFAEGGITSEEVAGVIRFIQTGLLGGIAATN